LSLHDLDRVEEVEYEKTLTSIQRSVENVVIIDGTSQLLLKNLRQLEPVLKDFWSRNA
jgi:hypothetical protein